jgi:DNA polymerase
MQDKDALATLAWLVEAGADEAIADMPVNRLNVKAPAPVQVPVPPAPRPIRPVATASSPPPPESGDAIGDAMAAAAAARTLEELRRALESFEGSAL